VIFPLIGGDEAKFEPIWVEDVVTAVVRVLDDPSSYGVEYELGGPEVLTLEEIEKRTLQAIGARRLLVPFPMSFLRVFVLLMEGLLPNPPVTRSLLELLGVKNVTTNNAIGQFVEAPRPFTPENVSEYMRTFRVSDTLRQFMGKL
jgi:NADH dehydrogenase